MTSLESLEAKMANIEQSLCFSVPTQRKKGTSSVKNYSIHSSSAVSCKRLTEDTKNSLQKLSMQKGSLERLNKARDLRKIYANNLESIRNDVKSKKNSIKNLKNTLQKLTHERDELISDIDLRIRQAELEYALGRDEIELMELLSRLEEAKKLQMKLESENFGSLDESLFGRISKGDQFSICAIRANTGRWNANFLSDREGLYVDWVMDGEELQRGDLIIEINGRIINSGDKEELQRYCSNTLKCDLVVVRKKHDSNEPITQIQTDNIRLKHRISYLEDQIKELSSIKKSQFNGTHITSINISTPTPENNAPLIYQRGSFITTIPHSSSNTTSTAIQKSSSTTNVNFHQNENNSNSTMTPTKSMKCLSASMSRISVSTDINLQKYRKEREKRIDYKGSSSLKSMKQNENIYTKQKHSKSLGYDTDTTYYNQTSEPISSIKIRQVPPTKPQRLSLQRTKSLQEVSDNMLTTFSIDKKRAMKRMHKTNFEPRIV